MGMAIFPRYRTMGQPTYVWIIFRSQAWFAVRKTHSPLLPRPRSTEHSSLHMYNPHSLIVFPRYCKHQASRFAAFVSVKKGHRLARQSVMLCCVKIDLIVVLLIVKSHTEISY